MPRPSEENRQSERPRDARGWAWTPLRLLGLAFVGLPLWNGVLWVLVGELDIQIGLSDGVGLQVFELVSVGSFVLGVFGVRAWLGRRGQSRGE